ncbi:hypothetical protein [Streptomyces flaveolus]|uniref:hypothetical protein n=1 Tax=Streptomyces flaveolus TaxID=67297 RepID=UPI003F53EF81
MLREMNWRAWPPRPPRLPEQRDGAGFVTRFEVESGFLSRYPIRQAGGQTIRELWVPAQELDDFNAHIVGEIQVIPEFR